MTELMAELTLRLPPELHQAVKDAARAADLSMAQWIRRAIRAKLLPEQLRAVDLLERMHRPEEEPWTGGRAWVLPGVPAPDGYS